MEDTSFTTTVQESIFTVVPIRLRATAASYDEKNSMEDDGGNSCYLETDDAPLKSLSEREQHTSDNSVLGEKTSEHNLLLPDARQVS